MTTTITNWNVEKGFGFVRLANGQRAFIHVSAIEPSQGRRANLDGVKIVVEETTSDSKGTRVVRALTEEEFIRREQRRAVEEKAAAERAVELQKRQARENELKPRLAELLPQLRAELDSLPAFYSGKLSVPDAEAKLQSGKVRLVSGDPKLGLEFRQEWRVSIMLGSYKDGYAQSEQFDMARTLEPSWDGVKIGSWHELIAERGVLKVRFEYNQPPYTGAQGIWTMLEYQVVVQPPYRDQSAVKQNLVAVTPLGEVRYTQVVYQNPPEKYSNGNPVPPAEMLGGFDISAMKAAIDTERQAELAALWGNSLAASLVFRLEHQTVSQKSSGSEGESADGMRAGGSWTNRWEEEHAVCILTVSDCPFLAKVVQDSTVELWLDEGLYAGLIEKKLRELCDQAFAAWQIGEEFSWGVEFGEQVYVCLVSQVPSLSRERDLWILDEQANLPAYIESFVRHGLTVVPGIDMGRRGYDRVHLVKSRLVKVVPQAEAQKFGLPGEPLPGPMVVFWPVPSTASIAVSPRQRAESLMLEMVALMEHRDELKTLVEKLEQSGQPVHWGMTYDPADMGDARHISRNTYKQVLEGEPVRAIQQWVVWKEQEFSVFSEEERQAIRLYARQVLDEILVSFSGYNCRQSKYQEVIFVVRPGGTLRPESYAELLKESSAPRLTWLTVRPQEAACRLRHWGTLRSMSRERVEWIVKAPVGGFTSQQKATIREIEKSLEKEAGLKSGSLAGAFTAKK